jgi:predicted NBD/HSP70 family sugar kinase
MVGKLNERQVLRIIQIHGPMSRAEVVRQSGISAPTVSKAVSSLPAPVLRLAVERSQVLGVVIDVGICTVVAAGLDGEPVPGTLRTFPTPKTYASLISQLEVELRELVRRPDVTTLGLGVSLPGVIDVHDGRGVLSPNVPITNGHTPARDLEERLGIEAVLLQEAHALCLAERMYGGAVNLTDFAVLDVGVGIGLGVMMGGRLLTGHNGFAGEIGHITVVPTGGRACGCGNAGCLETVAGDAALAWRISEKVGREMSVPEAYEVVQTEPLRFRQELEETAHYLAIGIAAVVNLFNPATIFLHSHQPELDATIWAKLQTATGKRTLPPSYAECRLLPASATKPRGAIAGIIRHLMNAVADGLDPV